MQFSAYRDVRHQSFQISIFIRSLLIDSYTSDVEPSLKRHCSGSSSGALGFLIFHSMDPAPASARFYTLIFSIVLVWLKLNGKLIKSSAQN